MRVLLWGVAEDGAKQTLREFHQLQEVVGARRPEEVLSALKYIEAETEKGMYAAGYITYEAAVGFDSALRSREGTELPLIQFGIFAGIRDVTTASLRPQQAREDYYSLSPWVPSISSSEYENAVRSILRQIKRGDTYQINYTFPLEAKFTGDPLCFFLDLIGGQREGFCAFIEDGGRSFCSVSPELFFSLNTDTLRAKPMKGTSARGRTWQEDLQRARALSTSVKNRAENVMIVDMLRNDLGRIAIPGSVSVPRLFEIERYPTVLQMTSTVECKTAASIAEIFAALFPCASITGAPKVSASRIIAAHETAPRGLYTGAIGHISPGRQAEFSVAIRTVQLDRSSGTARYHVGSGIVADSNPSREYSECLLKAAVLVRRGVDFSLFETLLWERKDGFFLLKLHLARIARSAHFFGFTLHPGTLQRALRATGEELLRSNLDTYRVRLQLTRDGVVSVERQPFIPEPVEKVWRVCLAKEPIDSSDVFLYHKTTNRILYDRARETIGDFDDCILWNQAGEVTESTIANVVVEIDGKLCTPPWQCGLLPGVFRQQLLKEKVIVERAFQVNELKGAQRIFLVNSLRRWVRVDVDI